MNNLTAFYKKNGVEHTYKNTYDLYTFFNEVISNSLLAIKNYKKFYNMTNKQIIKNCKRELNTMNIKFSNNEILTATECNTWTIHVQILTILNVFSNIDKKNGLYFYEK
jgi:hypothetical protein